MAEFLHENIGRFNTDELRAKLYGELKKEGKEAPDLKTLQSFLKEPSPSLSPLGSGRDSDEPVHDGKLLLEDTPTLK